MPERSPEDIPTEDPRPRELRRVPSLVLVNTGPGKGKTSAAVGVIVRALGRGWPVGVIQFLKSGNWKTGEEKICRDLGVDWWTEGEGFTWDSDDLGRDEAKAISAWELAECVIAAGEHRLVVLDEITYPVNWDWIPGSRVAAAVRDRPEHVNVVITGRNAPAELVEIADTVSEIGVVKHAYQSGIRAKKGIDY
ncbi:MAG: cob(I)yrinic acid a,c-diamide adenosyltransferase [Actinomycetota bacterium]